ncbi:TetR/AcrR family transcriptional regulator [Gordonia prachuapensis]|uniref:TetR/AcrR family transcriptional regulator n=1 Tax=Gordonia prachuapensis TaxID=3115651 RepID=UPI002ED62AE4
MPDSGSSSAAVPLPRGRHKLSADEVRASQRARLLQAMEELVDELGYAGASVPKVVRRARVSDRTFYSLFADKADCFIAVCEQLGDGLRELMTQSVAGIADVDDPFRAFDEGLTQYLDLWAQRPAASWAYFVELPAVGERAFESRDGRAALFAEALRRIGIALRDRAGIAGEPSTIEATAAAAVAVELVAREVRARRIDTLQSIHHDLHHVLLLLLLGRAPDGC